MDDYIYIYIAAVSVCLSVCRDPASCVTKKITSFRLSFYVTPARIGCDTKSNFLAEALRHSNIAVLKIAWFPTAALFKRRLKHHQINLTLFLLDKGTGVVWSGGTPPDVIQYVSRNWSFFFFISNKVLRNLQYNLTKIAIFFSKCGLLTSIFSFKNRLLKIKERKQYIRKIRLQMNKCFIFHFQSNLFLINCFGF